MAAAKHGNVKTLLKKLEEVTTEAIARFIIYYYTPEDKRKDWDTFKDCNPQLKKKEKFEDCLDWLTREDAIAAMQVYHKHMKIYDLTKLYESMLTKAMEGDVRAAGWVQSFVQSEYFDESTDEINDFLDGVNIPGLSKEE